MRNVQGRHDFENDRKGDSPAGSRFGGKMRNPEFNRLRNKLSFQGKQLKLRIKRAFKDVERAKRSERDLKKLWLRSQVDLISAEDELSLLCELANAERTTVKV
jgi:hypothetical protein